MSHFFRPTGNTVLVAATSSTASTPTQVSAATASAVYVTAASTGGSGIPIFVAFGTSSVQAAVPTTATPAAGMPIAAGQRGVILDIGPNPSVSWVSAATSAGSAVLYCTPGSAN